MILLLCSRQNSYNDTFESFVNTDFIAHIHCDERMGVYKIELSSGSKYEVRKQEISPQFMKWLSDANHS